MSTSRVERYVSLARDFAARAVLFHEIVAQRLGLHATDVKALRLLGDQAMTAGQLAEHTGLTGASVTALVDRLEALGYVTRVRDPADRRRVAIRAAPAKVRELDRLYASHGAEMAKLLATYDQAGFAAIADYLVRASDILTRETMKLRAAK